MIKAIFRPYGRGMSKIISLMIILPIVLSGCAGMAPKTTTVNYFPECYAPIAKLREEQKKFVTNVAAGALIGAVIGAGVGLALGGARGAIIGTGAGALAGGLMGYATAKQNKIKNDKERRASIASDIDGDISSMDSIAMASALSRKCYSDQFDIELAKFKNGEISKQEFSQRAGEIISGLNEIATLVKSSYAGANDKLTQYQNAVDAEYNKDGQTPPKLVAEKRVVPEPPKPAPIPTPKKKTSKNKGSKKQEEEQAVQPVQEQPQAPALPEGSTLEGGTKRCDIMAGIRDDLKNESDVTTAKAGDCLRITQEVTAQMKSDAPPPGKEFSMQQHPMMVGGFEQVAQA